MTLSYASGSFNVPGGNGNQSITGLGFQPSLVIFYGWALGTTLAATPNATQFFGAATSSTARWAVGRFGKNGVVGPGALVAKANVSTKCIRFDTDLGTTLEADFVSMDADGFTINWTTVNTNKIFYLAFGGVTAKCGTFATGAVTGNKSITGVGFKPVGLLFKGCGVSISTPEAPFDDFGAAISSSSRWATTDYEAPHSPPVPAQSYVTSNKCYSSWGNADIHYEADFVSLDADGFTINSTHNNGNTDNVNYIAFANIDMAIGNFLSGTTSADVVVTGLGFKPGALIVTGMDCSSPSCIGEETQASPCTRSLGMGVSSSNRSWALYKALAGGASTPTEDHSNAGTDGLIAVGDNDCVVTQKLDIKTLDNDGFTLKFLTTDNVSRRYYYAAFGSPPIVTRRTGHTLPCAGVG